MIDISNFPKCRLMTSFKATYTYDNEIPSDVIEFDNGTEVYVLAKVRIAKDGKWIYAVYSSDAEECTTVHECFLEGINQ